MRVALLISLLIMLLNGEASAESAQVRSKEVDAVLSAPFHRCFLVKEAPLNGESYDCLDREYHRLDAVLTREYRAALARQPNRDTRAQLQRDERKWWRTRFDHCRDEVGDLGGSTGAVVNEFCEIMTLARRIVTLRHRI